MFLSNLLTLLKNVSERENLYLFKEEKRFIPGNLDIKPGKFSIVNLEKAIDLYTVIGTFETNINKMAEPTLMRAQLEECEEFIRAAYQTRVTFHHIPIENSKIISFIETDNTMYRLNDIIKELEQFTISFLTSPIITPIFTKINNILELYTPCFTGIGFNKKPIIYGVNTIMPGEALVINTNIYTTPEKGDNYCDFSLYWDKNSKHNRPLKLRNSKLNYENRTNSIVNGK